jgi:N-acetyltransferase
LEFEQLGDRGVFDSQPTLRGSLIELHPLRAEDFADLYEAASDPLIWEQHPEPTRYKRDVFQKFFDSGIASKGAFKIVDIDAKNVIGSSRYYDYNPVQNEVIIGYTFLTRAYWGGTYNRELKSLMLDHAFRYVDRVLFEVGENNLRSQKALSKIGARFFMRKELPNFDGTTQSHLVFVIER